MPILASYRVKIAQALWRIYSCLCLDYGSKCAFSMAKVFLFVYIVSFFLDLNILRGGVLAVQPFEGRVLSQRFFFRV